MYASLLGPEIKELIDARDFAALRRVFEDWPPADLAELISELPEQDRVVVFRLLPTEVATDTFECLEFDAQESLLRAMGQGEVATIINEMSPDDRTAFLEELPSVVVTQILRLLSPEERAVAQALLGYPEGSVGRLMTPDFISVPEHWTVLQVFDHVRQHGQDTETLNVIYVVDDKGRLIDDVRIREFLLQPFDCKVSEIHDSSFVALKVNDDESVAVEMFRKYDRNTLPVVNLDNKLVGIVTVDDVLDVLDEEVTEDIQKMGGSEALDDSYLATPMLSMVRKRAPWLTILFLGEMLTTTAMHFFEGAIERAVVLAMFVPLIISSGGNSGSQASTLIIRAMALGEVRLRDWWHVMHKEIFSGLILGGILGGIGFVRIAVGASMGHYGEHWALLGLTVSITLMSVVLWGTLSGSMLPLLLKRLGLDPATSSAPFVATLVDVTGVLIYFSVAVLLLSGTIL